MHDTWLLMWSGSGDWVALVSQATVSADPADPDARHILSRSLSGDRWSLLLDHYAAAERDHVANRLSAAWVEGLVGQITDVPTDPAALHPLAAAGFGAAAEAYERGRPGYPATAIADLVARLEIGPGKVVLDLAAGTGKLTRDLVPTGAEVIAVEPVDAMAALLAREVPTARLLRGAAEAIPVPDNSVDVVTVAQAFHWFDAPVAVNEMLRVLRPGGAIVALWNTRCHDLEPWTTVDQITAPYDGRTPHYRDGDSWQAALAAAGFGELDRAEYDHTQTMTPARFVDRVMSTSYMGALPEAEADVVRSRLAALMAGRDDVQLRYRTEVFVCFAPLDR